MKAQRCNSLSFPRSRNEERIWETIPSDLIYEILLRAPAKSIARFRCLSKQWDSTLGSPNFTEQFVDVSSSRPRLLFTCVKDGETFFFSSSPPNPGDPLSPLSADFHMSFPINNPGEIARPVRGLVCGLKQQPLQGKNVALPLICNPSTGQSLPLPRVKTIKKQVKSFLLYDPIGEQFKVLCHSYAGTPWFHEQQVLTLAGGTQEKKPSWRKIRCSVLHDPLFMSRPQYDGICINGVLYYLGFVCGFGEYPEVICFNVSTEGFRCIKHVRGMRKNFIRYIESTLVNYKGKLAMLQPDVANQGAAYTGIKLWVLHLNEADHSHKWTCHTYHFTLPWSEIVAETRLRFVGTTKTGEIVMSPDCITDSFYLVYYNPKSKTVTKVAIQGMEAFKACKAYTFLDHVEDLKLRI